jgi:hypothetical protein
LFSFGTFLKLKNIIKGENTLRCITHDEKRPSPYCNPFLPYILISIKNNESKVVKIFKRTIVQTITILDSITIIHKCVLTWSKKLVEKIKNNDDVTRFLYNLKNLDL